MLDSQDSSNPSWRSIWRSKSVSLDGDDILDALIKADGFDTGFGDYDTSGWRAMVKDAFERVSVTGPGSVLEIGCGSGAFLHEISSLSDCSIYGLDYSESLVSNAQKYLPSGIFKVSEAINIPFEDSSFDAIFSHAVFYYFPNYEYAVEVISKSFQKLKSGGFLCLLDLNDSSFQVDYHDFRRGQLSNPSDYDARYAGLDHLFFDKDLLVNDLLSIGFTNINFFDHKVKSYLNSRFRFNIVMQKS